MALAGAALTASNALADDADALADDTDAIYDSRFPSGATLLDVDAYVSDGIQAHFDGIRNAGAALPHDYSARTWKNLVSGGPDATLNGNGGNWTGLGFNFDGASVYARLASPGLAVNPANATIQLAVDIDYTEQPSGSSYWPSFFHSSDNSDSGIYIVGNNNTTGGKGNELRFKTALFGTDNPRPGILGWAGKYATAVLSSDPMYRWLVDGTELVEVGEGRQARTIVASPNAKQWSWGGSARETSMRYVKGVYHSVRVYERVLSEDELVWNRIVDDVRFRGMVTNGVVVVESNVAGVEAPNAANGKWYVNGSATFTATEATDSEGRVWEPTGYKLERYAGGTTNAWVFAGEYGETTFSYVNCAANEGARIAWNWRLKTGARRYDADSYANAGLALNFDGVRNAGLGAAHDPVAGTWKNLGSLGGAQDATKVSLDEGLDHDAGAADGEWTDRAYFFKSKDYFAVGGKVDLGSAGTLQVVANVDLAKQKAFASGGKIDWPTWFGLVDSSEAKDFSLHGTISGKSDGDEVYFKVLDTELLADGSDFRFMNGMFDVYGTHKTSCKASCMTRNGWDHNKSGDLKKYGSAGVHECAIGTYGSDASQRQKHRIYGEVHSVRLYDRPLTDGEFLRNREIDDARFFGNLSGTTETDLVQVRSENALASTDGDGVWLLRGASFEKTFTAPASFTAINASGFAETHSCAGWRLEEMDAKTGQWVSSTATTGTGTSVTLTGGDGGANRRLTWLWTVTGALRTAADYDVSDYVQFGLVANFDGIRNYGADLGHVAWKRASRRFWRNIAPGGGFNARFWTGSNYLTANGDWAEDGNGFNYTGDVMSQIEESGVTLGKYCTIQIATTASLADQNNGSGYYPAFLHTATDDNFGIYKQAGEQEVRFKALYPRGGYPAIPSWGGKYLTAMLADGNYLLFEGDARPVSGRGVASRDAATAVPQRQFSWGGSRYKSSEVDKRYAKGIFHSVRLYDRCLTDEELAQNRKVDDVRFRGGFSSYANVTVVNGMSDDGVEASSTPADGEYEVLGSWTFTAENATSALRARYVVERKDGDGWTKAGSGYNSYTYTAGTPVRLTWRLVPSGFRMIIR